MAILFVRTTVDFSSQALVNINTIDFTNVPFSVTATFSASQFDNVAILDNVTFDGSAGINRIAVSGGSVDASGWQFINWNSLDSIKLDGSSSGDTITGSSLADDIEGGDGDDTIDGRRGADTIDGGDGADTIDGGIGADTIIGGAGADTLFGGANNDWFVYPVDADNDAYGDSIDGGTGTADGIRVVGDNDFYATVISNVERLEFAQGGVVEFDGNQFGGTVGISHVTGSLGEDALRVIGLVPTVIDLSGVSFANWTAGTDTIDIVLFDDASDPAVGSQVNDRFHGGGGALEPRHLEGLGGDDEFDIEYADSFDIDGGPGTDSFVVNGSEIVDFTGITAVSVENLRFNTALQTAIVPASIAGALQEVDGGSFVGMTFTVTDTSIDLSALAFVNWDASNTIALTGTAAADTIIGSSENDTLSGLQDSDILAGGFGADEITGGDGADTFLFRSVGESAPDASRDTIVDFVQGEDTMDVSAVASFAYIDTADFSGLGAAELRYVQSGAATLVQGDTDGDGVLDMEIELAGLYTLAAGDFIL